MTDNPALTEALVNLAIAVMTVLAVAITSVALPLLKRWAAQAKASGHASEVQLLETLAQQGVLAVEQQARKRLGSVEKRDRAADWLVAQADARGLPLSATDAGTLIEAAVRVMKGSGLEVDAPARKAPARTRRKPAVANTEVNG